MRSRSSRIELPPYALWVSRAGSGTPVLLVHGLSGSGGWWRRNVDSLASRHDVVAVDLPGFGRNRRFVGSAPPLSIASAAALLARLIAQEIGEPVHVVGHSMGGQIAIELAALRPDLVRSLTLVGATGAPFAADSAERLRAISSPPRGVVSFSRVLALDFMRAGPSSVIRSAASIATQDAAEAMRRIDVPTLLVWGDRDPLVPLRHGRAMHEAIGSSRLVVVPRAGHVPMWDNADAFNRELLEFLRDVEEREVAREHPLDARGFTWAFADCVDGICYRESGSRRDVVLAHGLGMSSRYFRFLAKALHERGIHCVAADLPGFGWSRNARAMDVDAQAALLAGWADAIGVRDAIWVGHSTGCQTVDRIVATRRDLVRDAVYVGPIWNMRRAPALYLPVALLADVFRERPRLWLDAATDYWRTGLWRWFGTMRYFLGDSRRAPEYRDGCVVFGARDPLPDRSALRHWFADVNEIPGAHGVIVDSAAMIAEIIERRLGTAAPRP